MRARSFAFLAFVLLPALAGASGYVNIEQRLTPEQRRETGLDTLTPGQLARLNALLRASEPVEAAQSAPTQGLPTEAARFAGFDQEPVRDRLKGTVREWKPGTVFELQNGQRWQVLKGYATLRTPLDAPEIRVVPGMAGRWFLQVHEDYPKARVVRVQ